MIRLLKRLSARLANAAIRRLNAALDRHNARVACELFDEVKRLQGELQDESNECATYEHETESLRAELAAKEARVAELEEAMRKIRPGRRHRLYDAALSGLSRRRRDQAGREGGTVSYELRSLDPETGDILAAEPIEDAAAATASFDAACAYALKHGGTYELLGPNGERIGYYEAPRTEVKK